SLRAEAIEFRCVVDDDVVRIEPGEPCARRKADEARLTEQAQTHRLASDLRPLVRPEVVRAVDVDVTNAETSNVDEVGGDRVDASAFVWLELNGDAKASPFRRAHHGGQPFVLRGAPAPPRAHDLV